MDIKYGTKLKIKSLSDPTEVDTVILVNNITDGGKYNCKVLDLSNYELVADYINIEDFLSKATVIEVLTDLTKEEEVAKDLLVKKRLYS